MGNCLRHEYSDSEMTWGGDYWGSPQSEKLIFDRKKEEAQPDEMLSGLIEKKKKNKNKNKKLDKNRGGRGMVSSATTGVTEVKIKISKKQLEELVGNVDAQGMSVQQMLEHLMKVDVTIHQSHQRSWRPALQSIPE